MVPIAWAMARTLKYKPSDPLHYLAYELFHWKHGNINQQKKESIKESIALATVAMDRKLILRKHMEQKKLIKDQNEEAMKNIPCIICKKRQELHRIKEACWKCVTKPITKQEPCEFPEVCSSCKMEVLSKKLESCQLSQYCSSCKIDNASLNKFEACQQFYA
ncbi:uncharacterized protein LOC116425981 [Nomia melanderi]|uniref:uncharacterized protein LOC116425981 n=1 Tax=Nomia melanderi TaxID=2448451 RepID=UPI003FCDE763